MNRDLGNILNLIRVYLSANFCYVLQITDGKFEVKKTAGGNSIENFSEFNREIISLKDFRDFKLIPAYRTALEKSKSKFLITERFCINSSEYIFIAAFESSQNPIEKLQTEYAIELLQNYFEVDEELSQINFGNLLNCGVILTDKNLKPLFLNERSNEIFSTVFETEQDLENKIEDLFKLNKTKILSEENSGGKFSNFNLNFYSKNGTNFWFKFVKIPVGNNEKFIFLVEDISKRRSIEEDIKLKTGNLNSSYFSYSKNSRNDFHIDENFLRPFGFENSFFEDHEEILQKVNQKDLYKVKFLIDELRQNKPGSAEFQFYDNFGKLRHLQISAVPFFDGNIYNVFGLISDVTKEKELLAKLKIYDEKFRLLIETANDLIFNLDNYGYFVSVNNYGALSLGYKPEEMCGKHFLEFIDESAKSDVALAFQKILKSDKIVSFEVTFVDRFGKNIVFEVQGRPIKNDDEITGLLGIGRDVTQRRQDEDKLRDLNSKLVEANRIISIERDRAKQQISVLEEVNKLKSDFISNISHELRTPLASIVGFSETIISDPDMPKEMITEFNNIILSEGKKLAKIINDLLDFAKYEAGKVDIFKSQFDVIKLLKDLIENSQRAALEKGVTLTANIFENSVIINGDKEKIEQVYQSLISNAIKFTNRGGRITVIAQCLTKEFEVIVSDTGIGIPQKDLANVFQKLYKVVRPGTQIPGIGLGLGLSKQIIDLHKGLITVQSEVNKGSTFVVKLPLG